MITRFFIYGILGCFAEILWTSLHLPIVSFVERLPLNWRLPGQTYLWMLPIYGMGGLVFELLHGGIATWHWGPRGLVYMLFCFVGEYITGWIIRAATGKVPWDYSEARFQVHSLIRLDYAPLWFCAGLLTETTERIVTNTAPVVRATVLG